MNTNFEQFLPKFFENENDDAYALENSAEDTVSTYNPDVFRQMSRENEARRKYFKPIKLYYKLVEWLKSQENSVKLFVSALLKYYYENGVTEIPFTKRNLSRTLGIDYRTVSKSLGKILEFKDCFELKKVNEFGEKQNLHFKLKAKHDEHNYIVAPFYVQNFFLSEAKDGVQTWKNLLVGILCLQSEYKKDYVRNLFEQKKVVRSVKKAKKLMKELRKYGSEFKDWGESLSRKSKRVRYSIRTVQKVLRKFIDAGLIHKEFVHKVLRTYKIEGSFEYTVKKHGLGVVGNYSQNYIGKNLYIRRDHNQILLCERGANRYYLNFC